jgi:hypothetical protein
VTPRAEDDDVRGGALAEASDHPERHGCGRVRGVADLVELREVVGCRVLQGVATATAATDEHREVGSHLIRILRTIPKSNGVEETSLIRRRP